MSPADPITAAVEAPRTKPPPAAEAETARAVIERQLQVLTRLAGIGMEIAEAAGRQATAPRDEAARPGAGREVDPGLTYARAARAIRLTIALQSRLLKDLAALDRAADLARSAKVQARRGRIHRLVEQAIEAGHDDEDEIERLSEDAWERLRDDDDFGDLLALPIGEAVARICRALALSPDWSAWAGEAAECGAALPAAGPSAWTGGPAGRAEAAQLSPRAASP